MDFFSAQDAARRSTRWLLLWFLLALVVILLTLYGVVWWALAFTADSPYGELIEHDYSAETVALLAVLAAGAIIVLASAYQTLTLAAADGATVAQSFGATPVLRDTEDEHERRLLNIVDEMAIAAGIAAPRVFVLHHEHAINAFACGNSIADSAVALTRGALQTLSRDQLQGVVAHEFNHILNGDIRLNLRLIGAVFGLMALASAGRFVLRAAPIARGRNRNEAGLMRLIAVGGLAALVLGSIGVFAGQLIQAAVSRQREFLADAGAVRLTRNPQGLAGALEHIRQLGSTINHSRALEASHLFLGQPVRAWFASHPPLKERIARLGGAAHVRVKRPPRPPASTPPPLSPQSAAFAAGDNLPAPALLANAGKIGSDSAVQALLAQLPAAVLSARSRADHAEALLYALLIRREHATAQLEALAGNVDAGMCDASRLHLDWLQSQPNEGAALRLPLIDWLLPVLRERGPQAAERVLANAASVLAAGAPEGIFTAATRLVLRTHLLPRALPQAGWRKRFAADVANLLALLARAGHAEAHLQQRAYEDGAAVIKMLRTRPGLPPPAIAVFDTLDTAVQGLAACAPSVQKNILDGCVATIQSDGQVRLRELELLRAIAQGAGCPIPPLAVGALAPEAV